jgi:hypothetical protein
LGAKLFCPPHVNLLGCIGLPQCVTDELAAVLGKKPSGGHWNSGIAVLRNNGLIEVDGRRYRIAALFRE